MLKVEINKKKRIFTDQSIDGVSLCISVKKFLSTILNFGTEAI